MNSDRAPAREEQWLRLTVIDAGSSFSPAPEDAEHKSGFGLFSLDERAKVFGGTVQVDSAPGQGCRVTMLMPMVEQSHAAAPLSGPPAATTPPVQSPRPQPGTDATPSRPIRVLLADDHQFFRDGLRSLLSHESALEIIGEAADGQEAIEQAGALRPDVVILDCAMPRVNGMEAARRISQESPAVRIIALSMHNDPHLAQAMQRAGASAYLTKDGPAQHLVAAILETAPV